MAQKNRNRRPQSTRRILSLEALEDRTLLSGNVTAVLAPTTGVLTIAGDIGNNSITLTQSGANLQVSGNFVPGIPPDVTTVNGVHFTNFASTSITSINISMLNGKDTVIANGVNIPNNFTITAGSGNDTFTTNGISASQIIISAAGPGNDNVTMNNTANAGLVMINTGAGADTVNLNGGTKIGMARINTGGGTGADTVNIANFPSVGPISGIGQLTVNSPSNGNNTINVTNSSFTTASIAATGTGNNTINFAPTSVLSNSSIIAGTGTNTITVGGALKNLSVTSGGGGAFNFNGATASSANIKVGSGVTLNANGNTITGPGGLSVTVGASGTTATDNVNVNNNTVTGPLSVNVLDNGLQYWTGPYNPVTPPPLPTLLPNSSISNLSVTGDTATGNATVNAGDFFRNVTVGLTAAALNSMIGNNSQNVLFNTTIANAENITVGNAFPRALSQAPISLLTPATFALNGSAGSLSLSVGNDFTGGVSQNAVVSGTETMTVGTNAGAVTEVRPTGGSNTLSVGDNSGSVTVSGTDTSTTSTGALTESITVGSNLTGPVNIGGTLAATGSGSWTQTISAGSNDTLNVSTAVTGTQTITVGSNTLLNATSVVSGNQTITSAAGTGSTINVTPSATGGALNLNFAGSGNTINVNPGTVSSLSLTAGDNETLNVTGITATSGDVDVTAGKGATITVNGVTDDAGTVNVTAGDNTVQIAVENTTASTMNITNGNGPSGNGVTPTFILLENDFVGTNGASLGGGLNLTTGNGDNTIEMLGLSVLDGLFVNAGTGINTVFAGSVVADFGIVNGGTGGSNVYWDLGGNLGYILMGFVGY